MTVPSPTGSTVCSSCRSCSDPRASVINPCLAGSSVDSTSGCSCPAGYFGPTSSYTAACLQCESCDPKASVSSPCLAGSTSDTVKCSCTTGFYGNGSICAPCQKCDEHARLSRPCAAGSTSDISSCECTAGYYGNGTRCAVCPAGSYSISGGILSSRNDRLVHSSA
jgi:hypothetical protein